ncbi:MAG: efflux RND transporter periplasmic adaptor subunit [Elusimicrobia bacterium]|nr:efflux RND transporter periplasmic adaptor subunit [Elusimicrobiota bacterium]
MKPKRILIAVVALAAAAFAGWRLLRSSEFLYAGTIEATEVDVSSRVSSVIAKKEAREGERVAAGQALMRLACEDLALAADLAEKDYKSAASLLKTGSIRQEAYDLLRFKRDDAALKLSWCDVRAPSTATVLEIYREPGELVGPGARLLTLADLSEVWAMVYVPENLLVKLALGQEATGFLPELGMKAFPGRIARINDEAEFTPKNVQTRQERTRLVHGVKVAFPNPEGLLKPGMSIEVRL